MMLNTQIKLDLITYVEMLKMIERQKRFGLCVAGSKRLVKANAKHLEGYKTSSRIILMYWDANIAYGWAMSEPLPGSCSDLTIYNMTVISKKKTSKDKSKMLKFWSWYIFSWTFEVDIEFLEHLHDKFQKYPPSPESLTPTIEWFSGYQQEITWNHRRITQWVILWFR